MTAFGQRECWCGKPWAPTPDGRQVHRMLQGHTPSDAPVPPPEPTPDPAHACIGCKRAGRPLSISGGTHCYGQGGVVIDGEPRACGCRCGTRWRDETEGWS